MPTSTRVASTNWSSRVVIERVEPEIEGGRYAIKRVVGEPVVVSADIFADGHDLLGAALCYRRAGESAWQEVRMQPLVNDRWQASFRVTEIGWYEYTLQAWMDRFGSWRRDFQKKVAAGQDVFVDLLVGIELIEQAARRASRDDRKKLQEWAKTLRSQGGENPSEPNRLALDEECAKLADAYPGRQPATKYEKDLKVFVDRQKARFSAWYEMFPRSTASQPGKYGTFTDCERRLPYIAGMGFDVLYFPPIHPIGRAHRKGKNNNPVSTPEDIGSPWAIGAEEGGHKDIHPELGTLEDFKRLMAKAREQGLEMALDLAYQCSPDHPWVKEHPEWFRWRPDGTLQYAENPPKKYEDIYPINFETEKWKELWEGLKSVAVYWIEQGVRILRVDNPHTKPFEFWEWMIGEIKKDYPDVIFLAEAFTRPKIMYRLAKLGFTQSYTYFAWRNTKWELEQYFTELTQSEVREYFRPNLWPNTPDILNEYLQFGGRPAFMTRFVLAATLGTSYGIYGPAFELCVNKPREPGSEEYLNSEKYEIKDWDITRADSLKDLIGRVNRIRRDRPALQSNAGLRFHGVDNDQLIAYSKSTEDLSDIILVVVNLDFTWKQSGWVDLPLDALGIDAHQPYEVHDLLTDARYTWHGPRNYVELDPHVLPAHIFSLRHRLRSERNFDYFS